MAAETPDPRTFKTWEDAFQYPVPVVQKLERQLRSHAADNREKLRSLVGASYRDLLDTAETIIDMEARMQRVEANLARVGQNCNSRNLDRIARSAAKTHAQTLERDADRYTFASQLSVLRSCPIVIARLMKGDAGYLLVAKVLVIARLLHKALSQSKTKAPIVDQLRDKLGSLRSRLLRRIDRRLASGAGETETLVETMCAYSLVTSSTPVDVLRHFHHVRMEEILGSSRKGDGLKEHGVNALKLCLKTCQDTQTIFPRRLADALARLKTHPLVQDPDVRALYELNLDIHHQWIGGEAQDYTPQPRHDALQRPEAERLLHQWSKQAISAFLKGIKTVLEDTKDLNEVAQLRQELIETWIVSGPRMAGVKSRNVLDDLRDTMNGQLETIVRSRAQGLGYVVGQVAGTVGSWKDTSVSTSLWSTTATATELSNGAQPFKQHILNTHQGRDEAVIHILTNYDKWTESVLEVKSVVKHMKEARWDDPFHDDVELDDSDEELGDDSKQTLLSRDDPRLLEEVTQDALAGALTALGDGFKKIIHSLTGEDRSEQQVSKAIFVLRVVREINKRIPRLRVLDTSTPHTTPFTNELIRPLHLALAAEIVTPVMASYQRLLKAMATPSSKSQLLWEGNPALPAQPSPAAFRFLRALVKSMARHGTDLWVPEAVRVIKSLTEEEVTKTWRNSLTSMAETSSTAADTPSIQADTETSADADDQTRGSVGAESASPSPDLKSQRLKQLAFDMLYIQRYLAHPGTGSSSVSALMDQVYGAADLEAEGLQARLKKSAADYARKTYLLFALLA
ncbi:uncharacterized protein EI97DRAFT_381989 [Westerdykella ornata]|uniref:Conserved oligomeric Golgi complex subunit 1 n=1 Tax=Westerdykella ornata TaxID=318751 RepID=A0A6A6JC59_WESOR|nr:uncharacterized protein EI97DRAFT_381989 [Westerdykella ornata]KAF2274200.1 hypothetical protein EI97DRAFT_381989 [Westerdykella ornata]